MPLGDVRPGMRCEARTVIRGTEITTFDAEVLDVVGDAIGGARILARVSGPAVEESGIGQGFSGSPVYCLDSAGTPRNAGAISAGVGDEGNKLALVTPIEEVLATDPDAPPPPAPAARAGRALAAPLTVSGLAPAAVLPLAALARRSGRSLLAVPNSRTSAFPPPALEPGASFATGLSSGDLALSSIGTITYVDGDKVWGFGHALDGVGKRSLFLQDAYVYTVVPNASGNPFLDSYKLAVPGHVRGALTADSPSAVAGRMGAEPPSIPMKVVARDLDTGRVSSLESVVASEFALGDPADSSALRVVGGLSIGGSGVGVLAGSPSRQSGVMCLKFDVEGLERPLRVCNRYVGRGIVFPEGSGISVTVARMVADYDSAMDLLEGYDFGPLRIRAVEASLKLRRGLASARLVGVRAPRRARRGERIRLRLRFRRAGGGTGSAAVSTRVPRNLKPGLQPLTLAGTDIDLGEDLDSIIFTTGSDEEGDPPPASLDELAAQFGEIRHWDGVRATFGAPETPDDLEDFIGALLGGSGSGRAVYRHPRLRISGSAVTAVQIRR